jgi:hypothetical protein
VGAPGSNPRGYPTARAALHRVIRLARAARSRGRPARDGYPRAHRSVFASLPGEAAGLRGTRTLCAIASSARAKGRHRACGWRTHAHAPPPVQPSASSRGDTKPQATNLQCTSDWNLSGVIGRAQQSASFFVNKPSAIVRTAIRAEQFPSEYPELAMPSGAGSYARIV